MKDLLPFLLVVVLSLWWFQGGKLPDFITNKTIDKKYVTSIARNGTCEGKKSCLLVYVAPWCPACKQMEPLLKHITMAASRGGEHGVKIVVGQGRSPGDNEKLAGVFAANGVVDSDGSIHDKLNVKHYPTLMQLDPKGNIIQRDSETLQWAVMNILTDSDRQEFFKR